MIFLKKRVKKTLLMYTSSIGSNSRPEFSTFLCYRSSDGRTLHLSLVVDDNSCIVLKVQEHSVLPAEGLPLSNYYSRHYLLTKFWFSLLHRGHKHISCSC